jgi:hypothetical protein
MHENSADMACQERAMIAPGRTVCSRPQQGATKQIGPPNHFAPYGDLTKGSDHVDSEIDAPAGLMVTSQDGLKTAAGHLRVLVFP